MELFNCTSTISVPLYSAQEYVLPKLKSSIGVRLCSAVINGEKSVFQIPVFAQKRERTLDLLIQAIVEKYLNNPGRSSPEKVSSFALQWDCR